MIFREPAHINEEKWIADRELEIKENKLRISLKPEDKRKHKRHTRIGKALDLAHNNKKHLRRIRIKNISAGGMLISTDKSYKIGDNLSFNMKKDFSEGVHLILTVDATVIRISKNFKDYDVNLKFIDVPSEQFNNLLSFFEENSE